MDASGIKAAAYGLLIVVAGAGAALAAGKPAPTPPPATYPPARYWQSFASNTYDRFSTASRLYMFGGTDASGTSVVNFNDLWWYSNAGSSSAKWNRVPSAGTWPTARFHVGWSCGDGYCVAASGTSGTSYLKETWVFTESTASWYQVNCKRYTCPVGRAAPAIAYDPERMVHVLFGGDANTAVLADTFIFDVATRTWTKMGSNGAPSARFAAAATFVPPLHRVVMFGGGNYQASQRVNDMYAWSGTAWEPIEYTNPQSEVPSLDFHSIVWDSVAGHMIVTGGLIGPTETANDSAWYVTFADGKATWSKPFTPSCVSATSSPPDVGRYLYARMAYDAPSGVQVFFGGLTNFPLESYGNTVECR